jgi:hypothetical protein
MTELIWDGKYKDGKKVAPVRIALPFQTIETVNESALDRKRTLDLFAAGRETDWRNRPNCLYVPERLPVRHVRRRDLRGRTRPHSVFSSLGRSLA